MSDKGWVTTPQIAKAMGVKLSNYEAWELGSRVRERWRQSNGGRYPLKKLAEKTSGHGSHCFAHYPPEWESIIREEIERITNCGGQIDMLGSGDRTNSA